MGSATRLRAWLGYVVAVTVAACGARSELHGGQTGTSTSTAGAATAGTSASNMAGNLNVAGTASGSGGASPSEPLDNAQLCRNHCKELAVCLGDFDLCEQSCLQDLAVGNDDCSTAKRERVACLTRALAGKRCDGEPPVDAFTLCGDYLLPPSACEQCETTLSETDSDCNMLRSCGQAGTAEIICSDASSSLPSCYCYLHGGSTTGSYPHSPPNEGCRAAVNQWLCFRQLAPSYLR